MAGKLHVNLRKNMRDLGDILINEVNWLRYLEPQASGCINHTGGRHAQGYRMCSAIRKSDNKKIMTVVHRVAMRMKLGRAISSQEFVIHSCDNDSCVNPDHLVLGDAHTRNAFMKQRGTQRTGPLNTGGRRVDEHGNPIRQNRNYKYTEDELRWFRTAGAREIAARLGCDLKQAGALRYGARHGYKWVK